MEDSTQKKLEAAGEMGYGAFRIASGVLTLAGHGIVAALGRRGMNPAHLQRYAQLNMETGWDHLKKGFENWGES